MTKEPTKYRIIYAHPTSIKPEGGSWFSLLKDNEEKVANHLEYCFSSGLCYDIEVKYD